MQPLTSYTCKVNPFAIVLNSSLITLFVLSALTVAGHPPLDTTALSGASITIGGTVLAYSLLDAWNSFKERRFELLFTAFVCGALIFVGIHGLIGTLNTAQVGWGILGTGISFVALGLFYQARKKLQHFAEEFFQELKNEPLLAGLTFLLSATALVIGALGGQEILNGPQIGWAVGGSLLTYIFLRECYKQRGEWGLIFERNKRELLDEFR